MSKPEVHFEALSTSQGAFQTIDEVQKLINTLLPWLKRLAKERKYSFICFAGASMWHSGAGEIKVGYRGKKEFVAFTKNGNPFTGPHMHMVLLGKPADGIAKEIRKYLRNRGIKLWYEECDSHFEREIRYAMSQCINTRTASYNIEQLPQAAVAEFFKIAEYYNKLSGGVSPVFIRLSDEYFKMSLHDLFLDLFINCNYVKTPKSLGLSITNKNSGDRQTPQ